MPKTKRTRTVRLTFSELETRVARATHLPEPQVLALASVLAKYAARHDEPPHFKSLRLSAQRFLEEEERTSGAGSPLMKLVAELLEEIARPIELAENERRLEAVLEGFVRAGPMGTESLVDLVSELFFELQKRAGGPRPLARGLSVVVERGMNLVGPEGLTEKNLLHLLATRVVESHRFSQTDSIATLEPLLTPLGLWSRRIANENSATVRKLKVLFDRHDLPLPDLGPQAVVRTFVDEATKLKACASAAYTFAEK